MIKFILTSFIVLASINAFSAKFKPESKLKSAALEEIAIFSEPAIAESLDSQKYFNLNSDIQDVFKYSFVRKPKETNLGTVKQFAITRLGQYADDEMGETAFEIKSKDVKEIVDSLLYTYIEFSDTLYDEEVAVVQNLQKLLEAKIKSVLENSDTSQLSFFGGNHSYEDGTWGVLIIVDEKTQEIMAIKLGFSGT